jgi:hypothetical protein
MATATETKPKTVLRTTISSDGSFRYELTKPSLSKLKDACELLELLSKVPALKEQASSAIDPLSLLILELSK